MFSKRKITVICLAISIMLFAEGCKKKVPAPPPPPPPAPAPAPPPPTPAAPVVAQFTAEPSTIQRGQSATLRWEVSGEANVSINQGIGTVRSTGSQQVTPTSNTTYTLTATGPGGSVTSSATVSIIAAATEPPPPPPPPAPHASMEERISSEIQDAYFDYDKSDVRGDARDALTRDAAALKAILTEFPNAVITVEGHCDERGSAEYNIGLGDRRASSARDFLVSLGVPAERLKTISYGKERPQCTESNEACWQKNRRAHFSPGQ